MRKNFELTHTQFNRLMNAGRPMPNISVAGLAPGTQKERSDAAWSQLGREMGFAPGSVSLSPKGDRYFTAMELPHEADPVPIDGATLTDDPLQVLLRAGYQVHQAEQDTAEVKPGLFYWSLTREGWSGIQTSNGEFRTENECIDDALEALNREFDLMTPVGYALVPIEPTMDMLTAVVTPEGALKLPLNEGESTGLDVAEALWGVMLKTALRV